MLPSASEGKNFKNKEQRFDGGEKKGRESHRERFGAKMEVWKE